MGENVRVISLEAVPRQEEDPVTITCAEVSLGYPTPLARIRYTMNGQEQEGGLRFDLDKRVFLDHLENAKAERNLQEAAPHIARILESSRLDRLNEWLNDSGVQQHPPNWKELEPIIFEQDKEDPL